MALVTLEQAKGHLRVTGNDRDLDIAAKLEQASDIILDYLGERAHGPITIVSSSAAAASVIETDEPHGFSDGATVTIADHEDSVPDINGSHTLTLVSDTEFSIPVVVTQAGTGGTATVQWSALTAPRRVQAATLVMLTHLDEGDMELDEEFWKGIERILMRSRDPAYA